MSKNNYFSCIFPVICTAFWCCENTPPIYYYKIFKMYVDSIKMFSVNHPDMFQDNEGNMFVRKNNGWVRVKWQQDERGRVF